MPNFSCKKSFYSLQKSFLQCGKNIRAVTIEVQFLNNYLQMHREGNVVIKQFLATIDVSVLTATAFRRFSSSCRSLSEPSEMGFSWS